MLITKALDSLWDVARRRYLGESGSITYISKATVEMAVYATTMQAMNLLKRVTHELIKLNPDGTVDGTDHHVLGYRIPREWSMQEANAETEVRRVTLPARQRDRQLYSTSERAYLPITPRGFQRGLTFKPDARFAGRVAPPSDSRRLRTGSSREYSRRRACRRNPD
ncbi:MAG: hypothetical protein P4L48_04395 [Mycobacterium sp.]|nr:hypothetical protein [Mycobacterium sp.]